MPFPLVTEWLFNNIGALIPVVKIHSYENGVKFRNGKPIGIKKAGIKFYIPYLESIDLVDMQEQTHNVMTQTMNTSDGQAVTFSCNLVYKVRNALKWYTVVHNFDSSLTNLIMMVAADEVNASTYNRLTRSKHEVEASIHDRLNERIKKWGAVSLEFAFTDIVLARAYRLFGDPPGF